MRRFAGWLAVGLIAVWGGLATRADDQPKGLGLDTPTCKTYGTVVTFAKSPSEAAKMAAKEEKLVMVLHISGIFEDPNLT
jgi:hypothetical protein